MNLLPAGGGGTVASDQYLIINYKIQKVLDINWGANYASVPRPLPDTDTSAYTNSPVVKLYKDCDDSWKNNKFSTKTSIASFGLGRVAYIDDHSKPQWLENDVLSSVHVDSGYKIILHRDYNFAGPTLTLTGDTFCLTTLNWNDLCSSFEIVETTAHYVPGPPVDYSTLPYDQHPFFYDPLAQDNHKYSVQISRLNPKYVRFYGHFDGCGHASMFMF